MPPIPTDIKLLQKSRTLEVSFDDGAHFVMSCEYLRINSPSAEVQGHGQNKPPPVTGKENVNIIAIEPVGNYAIKIVFDDGHSSGLYTWKNLYNLGIKAQ